MSRTFAWLLCLSPLMLVGCGETPDRPQDRPPQAAPSVTLRVAVVNDEPLAKALDRLAGEWQAQGKGAMETVSIDLASLDQIPTDCDVAVLPTPLLKPLCARGEIREVRDWLLKSNKVALTSTPTLVRQREIVYENRVMAIPLSSSTVLLASDVASDATTDWSALERERPIEWQLAGEYPNAVALLVRAASEVVPEHGELDWFDAEGECILNSPPFVAALESIAGNRKMRGPSDVQIAFADRMDPKGGSARSLPVSKAFYDFRSGRWRNRDAPKPIAVIGMRGTVAAVTKSTHNAATAFAWLEWVCQRDVLGELQAASEQMIPIRRGELAANGLLKANFAALESPRGLELPAQATAAELLTPLEEQISRCLAAEITATEAMSQTAESWRELRETAAK